MTTMATDLLEAFDCKDNFRSTSVEARHHHIFPGISTSLEEPKQSDVISRFGIWCRFKSLNEPHLAIVIFSPRSCSLSSKTAT